MSVVRAENVGLSFPLFGRRRKLRAAGNGEAGRRDPSLARFVLDRHGRTRAFRALADVSFELHDGDRLGVIGRNGSGKTTLLQVLGGVWPPDEGRVFLKSRPTSLFKLTLGIQPEASGHRNITLRGLAGGYRREIIEEKREEIAAFSELGGFLDMPVSTYSAGMRMRLMFATATAFQPEILLLDEWINAGDRAFRMKAAARMHELAKAAGVVVLASHSAGLIKRVCNKALWLEDGRIRQLGPIDEILEAYNASMPEKR